MTSRQGNFIEPLRRQAHKPLYANSLYVLAGQVGAAGLGALFWMAAARLMAADAVGIAVAANSAINLLVALASLGLGVGIVRFGASDAGQATKIVNACVGVGWPVALLVACVFLVGIPVWAPGLVSVRGNLLMASSFLVFIVSYALLNLQTSAMLSVQRGSFFFWRSAFGSVGGLVFILVLSEANVGRGAAFLAYNLPTVLFLVVSSSLVLPRFFGGFRPLGSIDLHTVRRIARYTTANYLADLFWAVPNFILPILAANVLSVEAAAYFYMPWMVGNLVFAIPRAVGIALFAQASSEEGTIQQAIRRASLFILILALPVVGVLWFAGGTLLRMFGDRYVDMLLLRIVLVSTLPFAVNSIAFAALRVHRGLRPIIFLSASVAVTCVGASYVLTLRLGSAGLAGGWLMGQSVVAVVVLALVTREFFSSRLKFMLLLVLCLFCLNALRGKPVVSADTALLPDCRYVTDEDLDADGIADKLILHCDLLEAGGLVYVFDRDADVARDANWQAAADFESDLWMFHADGDGDVQLIIDFRRENDRLVADLYDDRSGDAVVAYSLEGKTVTIEESKYPTVRVVAPEGWWKQASGANMNIDIQVDGPVDAAFDVLRGIGDGLATDGRTDFTIRVRDLDVDGLPDYDWRTVHFPPFLTAYDTLVAPSYLMVNAFDNEAPLEPSFSWPYLGGESYGYMTSLPHQATPPPVQVNWDDGRIVAVGEFVSSRGNDGQWLVYSFRELVSGILNRPNFKAPFAWYDLAGDLDRQPELAIRHTYQWPNDPCFLEGSFPNPVDAVRYSWDQDNDGFWDYKLGLVGSHQVESVVSLPDPLSGSQLEMIIAPYEELPGWTREQAWDIVSFVAAEGIQAMGEGIYEWDAPLWLLEDYFTGKLDKPVLEGEGFSIVPFATIERGYRGEYQLALQHQVILYISSVDHELHLLHAAEGIWNIDDRSQVRYSDLDKDGYIDQWLYYVDGELQRQLGLMNGYLAYSGDGQVILQESGMAPSILEVRPPASNDQWVELGEWLSQHSGDLAPGDLEAMATQFDTMEWQVKDALMRGLRPDGSGFRFILDLQPGFSVSGDGGPDLVDLQPGSYVISRNGQFEVQPLTPARLQMVPETFRLHEPSPEALQPVWIEATLHNHGLEDAQDISVRAYAEGSGGGADLVTEKEIALLAGESEPLRFEWVPPTPGQWRISLEWGPATDAGAAPEPGQSLAALDVQVASPAPLHAAEVWRLSTTSGSRPVLALLAAVVLAAASALVLSLRAVVGR